MTQEFSSPEISVDSNSIRYEGIVKDREEWMMMRLRGSGGVGREDPGTADHLGFSKQ